MAILNTTPNSDFYFLQPLMLLNVIKQLTSPLWAKVWKSKSILRLRALFLRLRDFQKQAADSFIHKVNFLPSFYSMNEKIWLEGLLVDFLQKTMFDKWTRRFLIHSAYLYNERVVFDFVVRFYIDYVVWASHKISIFDFKSISNTLLILLSSLCLLLITFNTLYVFCLLV